MIDKNPNNRTRRKKIGKFYTIILTPYRKDTAIIYVEEMKKIKSNPYYSSVKPKKHKIAEYQNTLTNQHALSIYNSTNTVADVKFLLNIVKPYERN